MQTGQIVAVLSWAGVGLGYVWATWNLGRLSRRVLPDDPARRRASVVDRAGRCDVAREARAPGPQRAMGGGASVQGSR